MKKLSKILIPFLFAAIFFAWIVVPVGYTVLWSLVDPQKGWAYPNPLPAGLSLETWQYVIRYAKVGRAFLNSLFIALSTTLLSFLISMPTAYAIARRPIKGKGFFKNFILLPMILPGMAMAIYVGRVIYALGLSGTYFGIILAHTLLGIPFMLRILIVGFETVPQDILDAASNLGAGAAMRLKEVYLPMIAPSMVSGSIFTFINSMEEFNLSFIIGLPDIKTVPTVLFSYLGSEGFSQTRASVVALILLIPNLIMLMIVERNIKTEYMGAALGKM